MAKRLGTPLEKLTWKNYSLTDPLGMTEIFASANVVFHCAAKVSFKAEDAEEMLETNISGTRNVVNACLQSKVKNLVYAGSVAALGRKSKDNTLNEDSLWQESPYNTPYAVSKHLAEMEIWRGMEEGLNVAIIDPGVILGAGDGKTGSNMIFERVRKGGLIYPAGITGFVGVEDVAKMMRLMYEKNAFGKPLIAVSENLSYKTVLDQIAKAMGLKGPKWPLNGLLLQTAVLIAKIAELLHLPFPFPSIGLKNTSTANHYSSVNHILDSEFSYTPIERVIQEAVPFV